MESVPTDFPQDLEVAFDSIWTANENIDTVTRIDPTTGKVRAIKVDPGLGPQSLEAAGGAIWVAGAGGIDRIDPASGSVTKHVDAGPGILYAFGNLWTTKRATLLRLDDRSGGTVDRIEASSGKDLAADEACGVSAAAGSIWLACGQNVDRIDPGTNKVVASIQNVGPDPFIVAAGGAIWLKTGLAPFRVASPDLAFASLDRVDPATTSIVANTTVRLVQGATVNAAVADDNVIWFPTSFGDGPGAGRLFAFDARSGTVVKTFDLSEGKGYGSNAIAFAYGSLWTATGTANEVRRFAMPPN